MELQDKFEALGQSRRRAEEAVASWQGDWAALWKGSGVEPGLARDKLDWLRLHERICEDAENIAKAEAALRALEEERRSALGRLASLKGGAALVRSGEEALRPALELAEARLKNWENQRAQASEQAQRILDRRQSLAECALSEGEIKTLLELWDGEWRGAMSELGREAGTSPESAEAIITDMREVERRQDERVGMLRRLSSMKRDSESFLSRVRELAQLHAPELLAECEEEDLPQRLFSRFENTRREAAMLSEARRNLIETNNRLESLRLAQARERGKLQELLDAAGAASAAEAQSLEEVSLRRRELESEREKAGEVLLDLSEGQTVDELSKTLGSEDSSALDESIGVLRHELEELDARGRELDAALGEKRAQVAAMNGEARAAEGRIGGSGGFGAGWATSPRLRSGPAGRAGPSSGD